MSNVSTNQQTRNKVISDAFLYDIGYQHAEIVCHETDQLLKKYRNSEVPQSLNNWFNDYNKQIMTAQNKQENRARRIKHLQRVAVVVLTLGLSLAVITLSVDAVRIQLLNWVVDIRETYTQITLNEQDAVDDVQIPDEWQRYDYPTYLPKGYALTKTSGLDEMKRMWFTNQHNNDIFFIQGTEGMSSVLDSEDAIISYEDINGYEAMVIEKTSMKFVTWHNETTLYVIRGNVDSDILIKMARSVKKIEKK